MAHGALLSVQAWREVGGFPEIVTEDLAFSMRLRVAGWRGGYAESMFCLEEFPLTLPQLRKRTDKWIRGTAECLKVYGPDFFKARCIPFREKLDVFMHARLAAFSCGAPCFFFWSCWLRFFHGR